MIELLHENLTRQIIGAYFSVYNQLGQMYPEYIYEKAMMLLLGRMGIPCTRQDEYEIHYKDRLVGVQRLDIFVAGEVVVELKVAERIDSIHLAQLMSYLKTVAKPVGLLLRFGGPEPEFQRRVLTDYAWRETIRPLSNGSIDRSDLLLPELAGEIIGGALEVFKTLGPGFIHRIYANACYHELLLRGLEVLPRSEFHVFLGDSDLGAIKLAHLQVDTRVLVFPVTLSDPSELRIANLKAWMRHLNVPLGLVFNFKTNHLQPLILRL